ncbi:Gfo/Idh/MocA family protein [Microlunatus sp. GCM10028923]|uniref:Gfo/Idh/MocA family protein n=1 Tax=Microlunatus sp. GCM10028923 TaxID=3273400 RepID=UPI00362338DD
MAELGVGIVGANPDTGWAFTAHVPAIAATEGLRVTAVATTREATAKRAAAELGTDVGWHTDPVALVRDPKVDIVLISVKVPKHRELIMPALEAGKQVLSEWPLGVDTAEATALAEAADRAGVRGFIGFQGRGDPVINQARRLIGDGALGELQALSVRSSRSKGSAISAANAYTLDVSSAAGNLEVHGGHLIDLLGHLIPGLAVINGETALLRRTYRIAGTETEVTATSPDVFTAAVRLGDSGGVGGLTVWDGDPDARTVITLQGLDGRLDLHTVDPGGDHRLRQPQMAPFAGMITVGGRTTDLAPPPNDLPVAARNVATLYANLVRDLREGTTTAPTFADAVAVHRELDLIR